MNILARLPTLVELNESSSSRMIFCLHAPGGGIRIYEPLARKLKDRAKIFGLEDPLIYAEKRFSSLAQLAKLHVETIRSVQPRGPYILFGQCAGGPIAYEAACLLTQEGEQVTKVVMFGSYGLVGFDPAVCERFLFLRQYLRRKFGMIFDHLDWPAFESMEIENVCTSIVAYILSHGIMSTEADTGWILRSLETLCLTREATKHYRPRRSALNIDLFRKPSPDGEDNLDRNDWCDWSRLTTGKLTVFDHAPGLSSDDNILWEPQVDHIADQLRRKLLR